MTLLDSPEVATEFLRLMFADGPGHVAISTKARNFAACYYSLDDLDRAGRDAQSDGARTDVYVSALPSYPTARGRTKRETTAGLVALFADIDVAGEGHAVHGLQHPSIEEGRRIVDAIGVPPSVVVWSGNGFHVWWRLAAPIEFFDDDDRAAGLALVSDFDETVRLRGHDMGRHVDGIGDGARLLRVPGTWNLKDPTAPKQVAVIHHDPAALYSESDLRDVIASESERAPLRPLVAPVGGDGSARRAGEVGPADVFCEVVSWADILEPIGWRSVGTVKASTGLAERWLHPESDAEHSGYAFEHPPVFVNHSSTAEAKYGIPTGDGHRLTKFRLWAAIHYGGDERRAAGALAELGRGGVPA